MSQSRIEVVLGSGAWISNILADLGFIAYSYSMALLIVYSWLKSLILWYYLILFCIIQNFQPIPPPRKTKDDILLFLKLYDPEKENLR